MSFIGLINEFIFVTYHKNILGITYRHFVLALFPILAFTIWWPQWEFSDELAIGFLGLYVVANGVYRWVKRKGFARFVKDNHSATPAEDAPLLIEEKKYNLHATGIFANEKAANYMLLQPSQMWRMPYGDVALMVKRQRGQFFYEFIQPQQLEGVMPGKLLFGSEPRPSLAIHFGSTWGPEYARKNERTYVVGSESAENATPKIIYLTFADVETMRLAWRTLLAPTKQHQAKG